MVVVGNGTTIRGRRICKAVTLESLELTIREDFLPFDLGRVDVILGMQWLYSMGYMGVHWLILTMTFTKGDQQVVLKGDPSLTKAEVFSSLMKT